MLKQFETFMQIGVVVLLVSAAVLTFVRPTVGSAKSAAAAIAASVAR
jgi:hypothetical protein